MAEATFLFLRGNQESVVSSKPSDQNDSRWEEGSNFTTTPRGLVRWNGEVPIGLVNIELSGDFDKTMES